MGSPPTVVTITLGYRYFGDVEHVSLWEREKTECHCVAWALHCYLPVPSFAPFHRVCRSHSQGHDAWKGVISVVRQAKRANAMQQIIVSSNDTEDVWIETPTGHRLAECFFKAPDETPEELEHMGYPQLLHLYPLEEILVGPGMASEDVEEIFVEA